MIVLDTHTLVWLTEGSSDLGPEARKTIDEAISADVPVSVSAITFWEIAMLASKRRLQMVQPIGAYRKEVLGLGIEEIPVTGETGIEAANLQSFHPDPADRLIVASTSLRRGILVTADRRILEWPGALSRIDARV